MLLSTVFIPLHGVKWFKLLLWVNNYSTRIIRLNAGKLFQVIEVLFDPYVEA